VRFCVLGSGSSGNAVWVESGETRLLVDAGFPRVELERRLTRVAGARLSDLSAVLITHEHTDHTSGVAALSASGVPVYCTRGTADAMGMAQARAIEPGHPLAMGELSVLAVRLPHDAADPVGYVLSTADGRLGILTDCGHAERELALAFAGCDALILECNHDPSMLRYGPYPPTLRRRVGGRLGHLSNEQALAFVRMLPRPHPRWLVAAHLSQVNNRPRLVRGLLERALTRDGIRVVVATQAAATPALALGRGDASPSLGEGGDHAASTPMREQLDLPLLSVRSSPAPAGSYAR
jgi:phosphoribosyl 1,2-cyclic phosphodiesterase